MEKQGIKYVETYPVKTVTKPFFIKAINPNGPTYVTYKEIDFNNKLVTIYNKDFGLSREGNLAEIQGLPTGEIWNKDEAISSPVIKKEYLNHISEEPIIGVDVTFDRGNASAFENHFKLAECNTYEDIENYGNNYFNLT